MSFRVVDTHAHLCSEAFDADKEQTLAKAHAAGVAWVLNVADSVTTAREGVEWAGTVAGLYATVGVHPHKAAAWDAKAATELQTLLRQPKVVAVGEIGLDYHYDFAPRDLQRVALRAQLRMAQTGGLPVVLHNREADADMLAELADAGSLRGVLHCFWSNLQTAHRLLEMGLYLGVGGAITFGNAAELRDVIRQIPLQRLVLETDAPYLAPKPYRGKRNEPAYVVQVAHALAELHGTTVDRVADITSHNAEELFLSGRK